jgi:hypothetical protein
MKKKLTLAIIGLLVGIGALGVILNSTFNPKPRVIAKEKVAFTIPADELQYFFAHNEQVAIEKYMDQVLEISGQVTEIGDQSIVLDKRVQVNFLSNALENLTEGDELTIKGRCVGFDELLLQVKIDQALVKDITN